MSSRKERPLSWWLKQLKHQPGEVLQVSYPFYNVLVILVIMHQWGIWHVWLLKKRPRRPFSLPTTFGQENLRSHSEIPFPPCRWSPGWGPRPHAAPPPSTHPSPHRVARRLPRSGCAAATTRPWHLVADPPRCRWRQAQPRPPSCDVSAAWAQTRASNPQTLAQTSATSNIKATFQTPNPCIFGFIFNFEQVSCFDMFWHVLTQSDTHPKPIDSNQASTASWCYGSIPLGDLQQRHRLGRGIDPRKIGRVQHRLPELTPLGASLCCCRYIGTTANIRNLTFICL